MTRPGPVDVVVVWTKFNFVNTGCDADITGPLLIRPDKGGFNKPDIRIKISDGAMPCVIGIE